MVCIPPTLIMKQLICAEEVSNFNIIIQIVEFDYIVFDRFKLMQGPWLETSIVCGCGL